jgi:lipopolysaccharide/colanic/teichoic acid biosynthesis glycosyltransferase
VTVPLGDASSRRPQSCEHPMPNTQTPNSRNKLHMRTKEIVRRTAPRPGYHPSDLTQRILPQDLFLSMLCFERKRAERSGKKFFLMLLDVNEAAGTPKLPGLLKGIVKVATAARRETDLAGWYKENEVLGIIFTELGEFHEETIVLTLLERVRAGCVLELGETDAKLVHVSMHTFGETGGGIDKDDSDTDISQNPAFYPDLFQEDDSKKVPLVLKRAIDVLASGIALLLLSPVLLVIGLLVKLGSKGPILFRQQRLGQYGKSFTFLKFRSMRTDCDSKIHQEYVRQFIAGEIKAEDGSTAPPVFKIKQDPRVTPIGRILRKTSLDELPQFWNVLVGDMSLVGPRPPVEYEFRSYDIWHRRRVLEMKPGITGLWQVHGRSRTRFDEMVRLDLKYCRVWSIWLDLTILAKTPGAVFTGEGAH